MTASQDNQPATTADSPHRQESAPTPAGNPLLDVAYIAVFAALIIALAFVAIPVGAAGVPIVLQNAAVILAGLILGRTRGFLTALLVLGLGLIGLPVLAGGKTTLAALGGPPLAILSATLYPPRLLAVSPTSPLGETARHSPYILPLALSQPWPANTSVVRSA